MSERIKHWNDFVFFPKLTIKAFYLTSSEPERVGTKWVGHKNQMKIKKSKEIVHIISIRFECKCMLGDDEVTFEVYGVKKSRGMSKCSSYDKY